MVPPLSVLLPFVVLGSALTPASSSSPFLPQCKFEYTAMALLSCQETPPQSPTRSCCDALLLAVDVWPLSDLEKGACCLCVYVVAKKLDFDLAGSYVACGGKDSAAVQAWRAAGAVDCDAPCSPRSPALPPPSRPSGGGGGGGSGGSWGRKKKKQRTGPGAIAAIVIGCVAGLALLGWCIYRTFFSAAAKERTSPDPSDRSSASDGSQPAGADGVRQLQMSRMSSARRSTSTLLD